MMSTLFNNPIAFVLWLVALIVAITVHEFSHALAAERLGDPTPRLMGRLTLNPLAHLDPIGTIMLLIARFGWGKPVQFDPFNLRNPRRDAAIISIAGPVSNLLLATVAAVLFHIIINLRFTLMTNTVISLVVYSVLALLQPIIMLNVILAVFNLIPIHPLDGFAIVRGILPEEYARQWQELEGYGMIFLIFLIFPIFGGVSPISQFMSPIINFILSILLPATPVV